MYAEASYINKKDQQVPILSLDTNADPTPLLEEILTHEQNTCIQIRDTCTLMAQSVRDVLGSTTPHGGYVQAMQDKLGELEKAVNSLETTIKRKSVFSNDFLDSASQRWFEKRLSSQSRKRRLRNFKRKEAGNSPPIGSPSTPSQYTFLPFDQGEARYQPSSPPVSSVPSPRSPMHGRPFVPPLTSITVPSTSPNNSPRSLSARGSPSACVPSTPSYSSSSSSSSSYHPTPSAMAPSSPLYKERALSRSSDQYMEDVQAQSMSISNIIN